jgi:hypothetical protein
MALSDGMSQTCACVVIAGKKLRVENLIRQEKITEAYLIRLVDEVCCRFF